MKFTSKGKIEITIDQKSNDIIEFCIEDTGIGIRYTTLEIMQEKLN